MSENTSDWNFFSNYAHVLVCLAVNPDSRLRDIAERIGITERTAVRLVTQLEEASILARKKAGRRNSYVIDLDRRLRHPIESHRTVGDLLATILSAPEFNNLLQRSNSTGRRPRSRKMVR